MLKINFKKLIFLVLITACVAGVLGCVKKEAEKPVVNSDTQSVNQNVNTNTTAQNGDINTSDWLTYRNEEYGFEVRYPERWKLSDCTNTSSRPLVVYISDDQNHSCNSKGGRINIIAYSKRQIDFYKKYDYYEVEDIDINNISMKQINGYYEIKGAENEKLVEEPKTKIKLTLIAHKNDEYIVFSYNEIFYVKNDISNNFTIEKNYINIYDTIIDSFQFID